MQTGKTRKMPIILVHSPYRRGLLDWFRDRLQAEHMIDPADLDLVQTIDDPAAIVEAIFKYYEKGGSHSAGRTRDPAQFMRNMRERGPAFSAQANLARSAVTPQPKTGVRTIKGGLHPLPAERENLPISEGPSESAKIHSQGQSIGSPSCAVC